MCTKLTRRWSKPAVKPSPSPRRGRAGSRAQAAVTVAPGGTRVLIPPAPKVPNRSGAGGGVRSRNAFTLIEVLVASSLALMSLLIVSAFSLYSSRSFVAIANYVDLDQQSQQALDKMSREIRQCRMVTSYSPTSISLLDPDNNPVQFVYQPGNRTLVGVWNGKTNVYLSDCDSLQFTNYQRQVIANTFDAYSPAYVTDTKLIQVTWVCSRQILGAKANSESIQSAKIVLRNSGNVTPQ